MSEDKRQPEQNSGEGNLDDRKKQLGEDLEKRFSAEAKIEEAERTVSEEEEAKRIKDRKFAMNIVPTVAVLFFIVILILSSFVRCDGETSHIKGIVVDVEPLTIFSDDEGKEKIFMLEITEKTAVAGEKIFLEEITVGDRLEVGFGGTIMDGEPEVLKEVRTIKVEEPASNEETLAAEDFYNGVEMHIEYD